MAKKRNNKNVLKSDCCKAPIRYSSINPDFVEDNSETMTVGTDYCICICTKCNKPCNIYIRMRKAWIRNPAEKIKGDNRERIKKEITKKEIKEETS